MPKYQAPLRDMKFLLNEVLEIGTYSNLPRFSDAPPDVVDAVLEGGAAFAQEVLQPLNMIGDRQGCKRNPDASVTTPEGFKAAFKQMSDDGWMAMSADQQWGGQGLPRVVSMPFLEMCSSANMAFSMYPGLTRGAAEAIQEGGSDEQKKTYLTNMMTGKWAGTMNLTEPQCGTDLGLIRTKAVPQPDGSYKITGQKIWISGGEQDLTENIVQLVLARIEGGPEGIKGISLFIVPKFLVGDDGSIGARNDVRCHSIEHKLGVHASPTCTMVYGDQGGAIGWLVGEENRGLAAMFTMMNNARLAVALQGVSIAERATQQAFAYAADRRQGRPPGYAGEGMGPIILHPDVKRMLMTMRTYTSAARAICYMTAAEIDRAHLGRTEAEKKAGNLRASLLTPIAKAFSTDIGNEVASLGVQVHGGMGFVEETGAAQHMRDARIYAIYEGTNGIQSIDLVTRKLPLEGGEVAKAEITRMRAVAAEVAKVNAPGFGRTAERLVQAIDSLDRATDHLLAALKSNPADALAGATPYGRLFGLALGGAALAEKGLAVLSDDPHQHVAAARFFAENLVPAASGLELAVTGGGDGINEINVQLAG